MFLHADSEDAGQSGQTLFSLGVPVILLVLIRMTGEAEDRTGDSLITRPAS